MGVPIKRSDMPEFCKEAAEKLAFDICAGQSQSDAYQFILDTYKKFQETSVEEISGKKSIKDYKKYVPDPIEKYVEEGFNYQNVGGIFQSKVALAYNYTVAKYKLPYSPIVNGTKFNFVYLKPNNRNKIEAIAFLGKWPKEFAKMYEVDHETMFRKSFLPVFESMFEVKKWINKGAHIELTQSGFDDFFV